MDSQEGLSNNDSLAQTNVTKSEPIPPSSLIPEPLGTSETSKLIDELYEKLGPRLGAQLVEANVVLTMAGARGQTEFFIPNPLPQDIEKIEAAAAYLQDKGICLTPNHKIFKAAIDGTDTLMVNVESLQGYERVSKLIHIPGIEPYHSSTGWEGLRQWTINCLTALEKAHSEGKILSDYEDIIHVLVGITKGYPDVAINDMSEWVKNKRQSPSTYSDIPYVSLYKGAEPNFLYNPDHKDDPSIINTVNQWGNILKDFYSSPWHQQLQKDPVFIQARKAINDRKV